MCSGSGDEGNGRKGRKEEGAHLFDIQGRFLNRLDSSVFLLITDTTQSTSVPRPRRPVDFGGRDGRDAGP